MLLASDVMTRYFIRRSYRTISFELSGCSVAVNEEVLRHAQCCITVPL
jgi:hypothetical protein